MMMAQTKATKTRSFLAFLLLLTVVASTAFIGPTNNHHRSTQVSHVQQHRISTSASSCNNPSKIIASSMRKDLSGPISKSNSKSKSNSNSKQRPPPSIHKHQHTKNYSYSYNVQCEMEFNNRLKQIIHQRRNGISRRIAAREAEDLLHAALAQYDRIRNSNHQDNETSLSSLSSSSSPPFSSSSNGEEGKAHGNSNDASLRPNHFSFGIVINGYAKCGQSERAERVLKLMEEYHIQRNYAEFKPDVVKYSSVITAYARRGDAQKASAILRRMEQTYERTRDPDVKPNTLTYTAVIDAWARSRHPQAARCAEEVLDGMHKFAVPPNEVTYNACMNAWAKSSAEVVDAPQHAEAVLNRMIEQYQQGDRYVRPSVVSYSTVMRAWANHGNPYRAEAILNRLLEEEHEAANNTNTTRIVRSIKPDRVMFNIAIDAWAKSSEDIAPLRAEALLQKMERQDARDLKPDTVTYNTVVDVWSKSSHRGEKENRIAAQRAVGILKRMERMYQEGEERAKPDART